jgi:hypothetical protein
VSDDYLWDGTGDPDAEVVRLELLLRPLGHDGRGLAVHESLLSNAGRSSARRRGGPWGSPLATWAAAAGVTLAVAAAWRAGSPTTKSWEVARLTATRDPAAAQVGAKGRLAVGDWIETDAASRARISVGLIGEVLLEPQTKVRLLDAGVRSHRLSLSRGILHARIWAPPGGFLVDTPSATAVDLGCQYTLEVDAKGTGLLSVESGWVGFLFEGRESFVPADAGCRTRPGVGPGTPFFHDASEPFKAALETLDFGSDPSERRAALATILAEARPEDALSLWHLLPRGSEAERARVYARMADLVPPPPGVERDAVLRGDRRSLDLWWNALGLEDVSWWRLWERPWAQVRSK